VASWWKAPLARGRTSGSGSAKKTAVRKKPKSCRTKNEVSVPISNIAVTQPTTIDIVLHKKELE